ncbi:DUF966 domain-containing protein [Cephalotus follicularis]|uniref:DUF966 domain-containing protein n=1 Tax=Cephalotus follicularis TaxID=3775 RepID=A0A1Q3C7J4_CEPFO|nr:DUF966 domain-containing protein [Cephalotus follicularis]
MISHLYLLHLWLTFNLYCLLLSYPIMALNTTGTTEIYLPKECQYLETSSERTNKLAKPGSEIQQTVPVVYYLSRNGQLEHPHFFEVPLSSPQGLYLRDVINRLNLLRGHGWANMHAWSSKRSYKNRFVWQDLSEDDLIYPCNGNEYILKGSQLLETSLSFRSYEKSSAWLSSSKNSSNTKISSEDSNFPIIIRRTHSWGTFNELDDEHKSYKVKTSGQFNTKALHVSTQTEDNGRQRRVVNGEKGHGGNGNVELSREDISLPASNSSVSTLESLNGPADIRDQAVENYRPSGRMKASIVSPNAVGCSWIKKSKRY